MAARRLDPTTPKAPFVGMRFSSTMLTELDELAARRGQPRSEVVRDLLEEALESQRRKGTALAS